MRLLVRGVDNVPGVPLVGPKKACDLLKRFGTLEEVLAHADEAPGKKLSENLKNFADQALMSRQLVRLKDDLSIPIDWDAARVKEPDRERLLELYSDFGFRRYTEDLRAQLAGGDPDLPKNVQRTWTTVSSETDFKKFVSEFKQQTRYCVDLETTGLNPLPACPVTRSCSIR